MFREPGTVLAQCTKQRRHRCASLLSAVQALLARTHICIVSIWILTLSCGNQVYTIPRPATYIAPLPTMPYQGTTEMWLVSALDACPTVRAVLGMHETVCTGELGYQWYCSTQTCMTLVLTVNPWAIAPPLSPRTRRTDMTVLNPKRDSVSKACALGVQLRRKTLNTCDMPPSFKGMQIVHLL